MLKKARDDGRKKSLIEAFLSSKQYNCPPSEAGGCNCKHNQEQTRADECQEQTHSDDVFSDEGPPRFKANIDSHPSTRPISCPPSTPLLRPQEQPRIMSSTQCNGPPAVVITSSLVYGSDFGINEQMEGNKGKSVHGGLFEMLTELGLADQYLNRLESEEIDMSTLQETLSVSGSWTLRQVLEDAGVDKAGPRAKIVNFLQRLSVS
jgi:hypothetical protein